MSFTFQKDGRCHVCGQQTNDQCDACERFICDDHRYYKGNYRRGKKIFCKDCFEKGAEHIKHKKDINKFRDW